jgi:hypothetical protein
MKGLMATRGLVLALSVVAVACSSSPTSPSESSSVAGTWVGTTSGPGFTGAPARFTLTERGQDVSGTFSARLGTVDVADGNIGGLLTPGLAALQHLSPSPITCPDGSRILLAVIIRLSPAGGRLTGTYAYSGCTGAVGGDISLTRQ